MGIIYASMGTAFINIGDLSHAQEYYEKARAQYARHGDTLNLAGVEADMGYLAQAQGYFRRGLQLLTASLDCAEAFSPLEATKIRWHMLDCYLGLNRRFEARDLARQVVAACRDLNDAFELGRGLLQLGIIEAELAGYSAARAALDEAEAIFTSLNSTAWQATVWLRRGRIALQQGDPAAAWSSAMICAAVLVRGW